MIDANRKRIRSQLALQLDPALIEEIKAAAEMRGQTITRWCADLFEAALADTDADQNAIRLAELVEQLPLSRGSVFELVKALGITTVKGPGPGGRGRVAWVSDADATRLAEAAGRVHRGEVRIADLAATAMHTAGVNFEAPTLEQRIARLECAVAQLTNSTPI